MLRKKKTKLTSLSLFLSSPTHLLLPPSFLFPARPNQPNKANPAHPSSPSPSLTSRWTPPVGVIPNLQPPPFLVLRAADRPLAVRSPPSSPSVRAIKARWSTSSVPSLLLPFPLPPLQRTPPRWPLRPATTEFCPLHCRPLCSLFSAYKMSTQASLHLLSSPSLSSTLPHLIQQRRHHPSSGSPSISFNAAFPSTPTVAGAPREGWKHRRPFFPLDPAIPPWQLFAGGRHPPLAVMEHRRCTNPPP